jgi:hypothetical protein
MMPLMRDAGPGWTDPAASSELNDERLTAIKAGKLEIVDTYAVVDVSTNFMDWTFFASASTHGCGLRNGIMFCQGSDNSFGELGDNGMQPNPQAGWQVGGATDWTDAAAGINFSCGLEGDSLTCWGRDDLGQLGDGRPQDKELVPTAPLTPHGWSHIYASANSTCGIQTGGQLWCWGEDHGLYGGWDTPVWVIQP